MTKMNCGKLGELPKGTEGGRQQAQKTSGALNSVQCRGLQHLSLDDWDNQQDAGMFDIPASNTFHYSSKPRKPAFHPNLRNYNCGSEASRRGEPEASQPSQRHAYDVAVRALEPKQEEEVRPHKEFESWLTSQEARRRERQEEQEAGLYSEELDVDFLTEQGNNHPDILCDVLQSNTNDIHGRQPEAIHRAAGKCENRFGGASQGDEAQHVPVQNRADSDRDSARYASSFINFITENPTVYHAVDEVCRKMASRGFEELSERDSWELKKSGKYFVKRNNSSVIAFTVGDNYKPGNGASIIATHIDALATRLKPVSTLPTKEGYVQLGVAPYAGALNGTWWDRDLGIGGRVILRDSSTGKIYERLVKLDWPIARIPTLAPHFGQAAHLDGANKETEMVPIIGLDNSEPSHVSPSNAQINLKHDMNTFTSTQPPRLVSVITKALSLHSEQEIINWDLELFDTQPAQLGGLDKELIFAPRIDDKLCSWCAIEGLLSASASASPNTLNVVACFDDEEIGSLLRQGAHSNFLPNTLPRIASAFSPAGNTSGEVIGRMYANSFLISADVSHAVNPNFLGSYLTNHSPRLNTGVAIQADPNGHTTTDAVSTAFLQRIAEKCDPPQKLQVFQIRNDSRSGGTVGPMLSSAMGMRAIDAGLPQLSMHSIRATTGRDDPGIGVALFRGFFEGFEAVDEEFR